MIEVKAVTVGWMINYIYHRLVQIDKYHGPCRLVTKLVSYWLMFYAGVKYEIILLVFIVVIHLGLWSTFSHCTSESSIKFIHHFMWSICIYTRLLIIFLSKYFIG